MVYIGIDIAKFKHFASVVSSDGKVIVKPFPFENAAKGRLRRLRHVCKKRRADIARRIISALRRQARGGGHAECTPLTLYDGVSCALYKLKAPPRDAFCQFDF